MNFEARYLGHKLEYAKLNYNDNLFQVMGPDKIDHYYSVADAEKSFFFDYVFRRYSGRVRVQNLNQCNELIYVIGAKK